LVAQKKKGEITLWQRADVYPVRKGRKKSKKRSLDLYPPDGISIRGARMGLGKEERELVESRHPDDRRGELLKPSCVPATVSREGRRGGDNEVTLPSSRPKRRKRAGGCGKKKRRTADIKTIVE